MKRLYFLLIFPLFVAVFAIVKYNPENLTQMVVTIPELSNEFIQKKLEMEFIKIKGVSVCETSLMTKTMLMEYDARIISYDTFNGIFQKWGCTPQEHSYKKIQ
tara:strand:+ start:48 stop:356 length:309 start_codon:yes stop_codon:yes gene_type:complete